jgi:hypothetical protein
VGIAGTGTNTSTNYNQVIQIIGSAGSNYITTVDCDTGLLLQKTVPATPEISGASYGRNGIEQASNITASPYTINTQGNLTITAPNITMTTAGSFTAPTVVPSSDSSTKVATTAFVQSAVSASTGAISTTIQTVSPVNLTSASTQNQVLNGSLAFTVRLPDATTLVVGRTFIINVNTSATAYTATINNFTGSAIVSNAQQGSIFEVILLTNSTSAGTWDTHSFLPSGANFGSSGLVYQGNLTFTGSGTSVISQSGSGNISITAPTLTGVPLAPTASAGTNTTQIATTAFVQTAVGAVSRTYDQVLGAGATATNKTATINDGGTNSTAVSATNFLATTSTGTNAVNGGGMTITNTSNGNIGQNTATATTYTLTGGATSSFNAGAMTIINGTNNTAVNPTTITITTTAGTNVMNGAGDTITAGTDNTQTLATGMTITSSAGNNVVSANGYVATNGTNVITSSASGGAITVSATGASSQIASGTIQQNNSNSGYTNNAQFTITNNSATAGNTTGVPSAYFYKAGRNAVSGDVVGSEHFYGKNGAGTKTEFARVEAQARTITAGAETGYWGVSVPVAGVMTNFLNVNANTNSVNVAKNFDMNGQVFKTSTNNINIDASTSSGTGSIIETLKAGGNLIINNLPTSSAGLPANAVWRNGNVLNIV